jgi:parvulin-like peptidyl-prolyl isomerase
LAKKEKKATSERVPTKHQLSKWQRQMKIRRIVIIAAVVFLVGISSWIGYGLYKDYKSDPLRQVVIKVNDTSFNMEYFVNVLDLFYIYAAGSNATEFYYYRDYYAAVAADTITHAESLRQAAEEELGIEVGADEIDAELATRGWPDEKPYRDIVDGDLLQEKVVEHFDPGANATIEQADTQVMLLESQEVADEVMARVEAGANFSALAEEFSCSSSVGRDLGWLPEELMPNTSIASAAFSLALGNVSQPIYDGNATKNIGYWLLEVTGAQNETIDAQVMLLGSEAEAERIKAELVAGGNFSALAGNYSQHASKTKGGKLDGLQPGDMGSTAFDQVAFNMSLNQVSEPVKDESVQTTGGYWIVKVVDRGDRQLDEQIREQLKNKRYSDWLDAWEKGSAIENLLDEDKGRWAIDEVFRRENQ